MLYRLNPPPLPRQRPSPAAMVTAGALHVAFVWLLLQHQPVQQAIRYVVYHYVQPITPNAGSAASRAITLPPPAPVLKQSKNLPVFSKSHESSVPLQTTTALPDTLQAPEPEAGPRKVETPPPKEAAAPVPVPPPPVPMPVPPVAPPPVPVPQPREPEPAPEPPPPTPAPVPTAPPLPTLAPVPVPLPAPAPIPAPPVAAPPPAPAPVPAPPTAVVVEPAPVPAPPAPVAAPTPPAPVAAPAAAVPAPPARLQGPIVDVPVPAGTPGAAGTVIVPVPAPPGGGGWGAPGTAPAAPPAPALPPAPVVHPIPPRAYVPHPGPYRQQQRSLADLANEQLRRGKPRDPLAEGIENAGRDDCLHAASKDGAVGGLLAAPQLAQRALTDKCAK